MSEMQSLRGKRVAVISLACSAIATLAAQLPAQAASFVPFSFSTNVTASPNLSGNPNLLNDPTRDVLLNSVQYAETTVNQFQVVNGATILQNDPYVAANGVTYGILNSGRGPNTAVDPLVTEGPSTPVQTAADIVGSLGNLNLNSLVVTRESASTASFLVSFANPVNTFFVWERGGTPGSLIAGDSDLLVEALADDGTTVLASYKILRQNYTKAAYNISSQVDPILNNGPFNIGSIGLNLVGGSTKTLRLTSTNNNLGPTGGDNGPDFKVVAAAVPASVPEPTTMLGLLVAGGLGLTLKRKRVIPSRSLEESA